MIEGITKDEERILLGKAISNLINNNRINQWERDFLVSIKDQISKIELSGKQKSVLEEIRQKYRK